MLETIKGYQFDLSQPVMLYLDPKYKFWSVTMQDSYVKYHAGLIKNGRQVKEKQIIVQKEYEQISMAKARVITKIADKITKGYTSRSVKKTQINPPIKNITKSRGKSGNGLYLFKCLQKGNQYIKFQLNQNQLAISKGQGKSEATQIKKMNSYKEAVKYVHIQERFYKKEGFRDKVFFDFQQNKNENSKERMMGQRSLTNMTDNRMNIQKYQKIQQQTPQNFYKPTLLGPPTSSCIKCLLAENYNDNIDPTGWIMSQKLDGVRCLWTGKEMFSRNANKFHFPTFFTKNWPGSQLDGQLFIGRCKFSQTLSAIKKITPIPEEWQKVQFLVFDAPGIKQPFKNRIQLIHEVLSKIDNPFIKCHYHRQCKGFPDLFEELQKVNKAEGQGIMLRNPESFYQNRRSKTLLKVKTFHDDEAEVMGYTQGSGRNLGRVGSLKCKNAKGTQFEVGSGLNDFMRENPPPVGSTITYKYQQFNKESNKPRFPTFVRIHDPI